MLIILSSFELTVVAVLLFVVFLVANTIAKIGKMEAEIRNLLTNFELLFERHNRMESQSKAAFNQIVTEMNQHTQAIEKLNTLPCAKKLDPGTEDEDEEEQRMKFMKQAVKGVNIIMGRIFNMMPDDDKEDEPSSLHDQLKEAEENEDYELAKVIQLKIDAELLSQSKKKKKKL